MNKSHEDVWSLIEDLSDDELATLGNLVAGLNRVEMVDGAPRYETNEMDLIGRFQDLDEAEDDTESEVPADEYRDGHDDDATIAEVDEPNAASKNDGFTMFSG